ncbi:WD40-repeat-containing domain protein [Cladochytrium replicatum]|nr:WD40-repeat-containing domain protein [Cladochytrium replicatum]
MYSATYSADLQYVLSAGADKSVKLWNAIRVASLHVKVAPDNSRKTIRRCTGHLARVSGVDFNQDPSVIASASCDARARLWDLNSVDGCIRVYDVRFGQLNADQMGFPVTSASFSRDCSCILLSTLDSTVLLSTGSCSESTGHKNSEYKVRNCLSNSDSHVSGGSEDVRILIWDLVGSKVVRTL